jgi:CBS domain-containing protein
MTLPVRTRCVVGAEGVRSIALLVFCPRREATIPVDVCERCSSLSKLALGGEQPAVECDPGIEPGAAATRAQPVGSLARDVVLCVRPETPLNALDPDERRSRVIPVVDASERYVGSIVQGRSSAPPSMRHGLRELLRAQATADDALDHMPTVNERDDVVTAATTMTSSRARCIAVVNDDDVVVGLLDDVTLLASITRAHRASEVLKRCSCGTVYTREQWHALTLLGSMRDAHGEPMELRTCPACGSTMVAPAPEASSDVA